MTGEKEWPLPPPNPVRFTLTSVVVLFVRLRRKTSIYAPVSSFVTRLLAELRKRTKRPSALMTDALESLFPPATAGKEGLTTETASTAADLLDLAALTRIKPNNPRTNQRVSDLFNQASGCPLPTHETQFMPRVTSI